MSSKTAICNRALINLGQAPITDITQSGSISNALNQVYDPIRKGLLRAHPWNFAMAMSQPMADADAPLFKYSYKFQVPNGTLRIWTLSCPNNKWKRFGNKIYTDDSSISLIYIQDIENTDLFDSVFEDCLALKIAMETCFYFSGSTTLLTSLKADLKERLLEAKLWDAQEEPLQIITGDTVLDSRRGF